MKTNAVLFFLLACSPLASAQLSGPVAEVRPPAEVVAETIVEGCDAALQDRCKRMKNLWSTLWENERATPAGLLGDAKYLTPKHAVTFHSDGRVTLAEP